MSENSTPTLGQKIDAVLEPLYAEAEQHRETIAKVTQQQAALQAQINAATMGLGEIESRMAEVVRQMAQQEPVIAAALGQQAPPVQAVASPAEPPAAEQAPTSSTVDPEPAAEPEPVTESEPAAEVEPPTPSPVEAQVADETKAEAPTIELDPSADTGVVDEAAALLDAPPAEAPAQAGEAQPSAEAAAKHEVDLVAAAERAIAAANKLREKAATQ